jgi:hypothetical protein
MGLSWQGSNIFSELYFLCYFKRAKMFCRWGETDTANSVYANHHWSVQWIYKTNEDTTKFHVMCTRKNVSFKSSHCSCDGLLERDCKATQCHKIWCESEKYRLKLCCWWVSLLVGTGMSRRLPFGSPEHDWCFLMWSIMWHILKFPWLPHHA